MQTRFLATVLSCLLTLPLAARADVESLQSQWLAQTINTKAIVGLAALDDKGRLAQLHGNVPFALLSVFKLHVAMAVLEKLSRDRLSLETRISIKAEQIRTNTYSPMRERYGVRDLSLPVSELLRWMVSESDNNASDILIDYAGGLQRIQSFARTLSGIPLELRMTENDMHANIYNQYANWSTPVAVAQLLKHFFESKHIEPVYRNFLKDCMQHTQTGAKRLKAGLPAQARLGHKTGSSDISPAGLQFAVNDAGFFELPDGTRVYMAVFIMQSLEKDSDAIAAHAARAAWQHLQ